MAAFRRQMPTFPEALPDLDAETVYALAADAPWAEETQLAEMEGTSIDQDDGIEAFVTASSS